MAQTSRCVGVPPSSRAGRSRSARACLRHARHLGVEPMASSRDRKRAKWQEAGPSDRQLELGQIANLQGVSNPTLGRVVDVLRRNPDLLDGGVTEATLKDTAAAFYCAVEQHEALRRKEGPDFDWACASVHKSLSFYALHSANFRFLLRSTYERRRCTPAEPWHMIVYLDEAVPGAVMRPDNLRKMMCYYVSFREFGAYVLKHEAAWLPVAVLRTSIIKDCVGETSGVTRVLMRRLFPEPRDAAGVVVTVGDDMPIIVFFELGNILYDGEACRSCLSMKGANGLLPCLCCKNVTNMPRVLDENMVDYDASDTLVDISCPDPRRFIARTDAELFFEADVLTALKPLLTTEDFAEQEKLKGIRFNPDGLLWDVELRPRVPVVSAHTVDATHTFLCDGLVHNELALLCKRLKAVCGITFREIRAFMEADWHCCGCMGGGSVPHKLAGVFSEQRRRHFEKHGDIQGQAGEMLAIIPPLRFMLEWRVLPTGRLVNEIASFCALSKVIGLMQTAKGGTDTSDEMAQAIYDHSMRKRTAYADEGEAIYVPKDHNAKHIPPQIKRDGGHLIDAFVTERYHSQVKTIARTVVVTQSFEKSVMGRAVMNHLRLLNAPNMFQDSLIEPRPALDLAAAEGAVHAEVASSVRWRGTLLHRGDLVRLDGVPHFIEGCCSLDDALCLTARVCRFVEHVTMGKT